jgi:hypothetical protein
MHCGRDEALSILRKWKDEKRLMQYNLSLSVTSFRCRGTIFKVTDNEIGLVSDDNTSEVALKLFSDFTFGYGDARNTDDPSAFEGLLWIRLRPNSKAIVTFTELK